MKKLLITLTILLVFIACKNEPEIKDYVTLSGKITNVQSNELKIITNRNVLIKTISVNDDGSFKDTLKVTNGVYNLFDGNEYASLYLENNFDINVTLDTKEFDETIVFTGNGSDGSSYLAKKALLQQETFDGINDLYALEKVDFLNSINEKKVAFDNLKNQYKSLDSTLLAEDTKDIKGLFAYFVGKYDEKSKMAKLIGTPSPKFINYENHKGGTTSLDDLKGKYVYVDVWATWCGPCKREIPFLKEVEKEFHGKDIEFVSISIDKKEMHTKWKDMVAEKELGGIQLFADNDWNSKFVRDYGIEGIPRFLLIDDKGNIVDADAPRPSNPKLKEVLNGLLN